MPNNIMKGITKKQNVDLQWQKVKDPKVYSKLMSTKPSS